MEVLKVNYQSPEAADQFCYSLKTTGFAVIKNHPIPMDLVNRVYAQWATFFDSDEKFKYQFKPEDQSGYFPFKSENAKDSTFKDLKEFFHIYPRAQLPEYLTHDTWDLYHRLVKVGSELLGWVQDRSPADVKRQFRMPLPEMIVDSTESLHRIIHYPPLRGTEEMGAVRAAAHGDINLLTVLCSATQAGLEVQDAQGNWHEVPCDPGSLAINAGDMLEVASGGYYKSTIHRVVNPKGEDAQRARYSMPLFLHPRSDVMLADGITAGQYLKQRLEQIGLLKR
jgi:isopenicillin N synthase-like dioxygenase